MKFFSLKALLYLGILTLVFIQLYPYIFDSKIFLGGDNASYYILANSLASGEGYVNYHIPAMPPANHFPPGYPFLMSIFMRIGIESLEAMKILNGILLLASSWVFFHITHKLTSNKILSIILALLLLLNTHMLEYSTIIMSEIPFLFFSLLTIYFFILSHERGLSLKSPYFYLMAFSLIMLIYTRTQGVALLGALLMYLAIKKEFKPMGVLFAVCFIVILPWQMRSSKLGGSSYVKQLFRVEPYNNESEPMKIGDWGTRVKENAVRYVSKEIPNAVFPLMTVQYKDMKTGVLIKAPTSYWLLGISIIILTFLGIWSVKQFRWLFIMLFGASVCIYLLWPQVWFGIRFILPMTPLILLFSILGVYHIINLIRKSETPLLSSPKFALAFALLFFLQITPIKNLSAKSDRPHPKNWENFLRIGEWSKDNLKEDAIIVCRKPGLMYSVSKRRSNTFLYSTDREAALQHLIDMKATHVVFEQLGFSQTGKHLYPILQKEADKLKMVKQFGAAQKKDANGNPVQVTNAAWIFEFHPENGYIGPYKDEKREGKGIYTFQDGTKIEGTWVNDTLHGPGMLTKPNEQVFIGSWLKGKKNGKFIIQDSSGQMIESYWENDVLAPMGYLLDKDQKRIKEMRLR